MAGIYIPGMKLPKYCGECPLYSEYSVCCRIGARMDTTVRPKSKYCPLVPVPDHGELVDKKVVREAVDNLWDNRQLPAYAAKVLATIYKVPPIISADKENNK